MKSLVTILPPAVDTKLPEPGSLGLLGPSMLLGWFLLVSPGVGGWLSRQVVVSDDLSEICRNYTL